MLKRLDTYREIINENRVVIANRDTGEWMKISKECADIINQAIKLELADEELLDKIADDEDRSYIKTLLEKLEDLGVVSEKRENTIEFDVIYLLITNRCNLRCTHCCADAEGEASKTFQLEMNTQQWKKTIDKVISANPKGVAITGGEPMIRNDFFEILETEQKKYTGKIALATNSTLISNENVSTLVKLIDKIDVSIDGIDEETCSKIRGKGVFGKVMNSIALLKNNGMKEITLSMTFGASNYHLKEKFLELNKALNTKPIIRIFMPKGRGEKSRQFFEDDNKTNEGIVLSDDEMVVARKSLRTITCGAGIREFVINYDGSLYPCPNMVADKYRFAHVDDFSSFQKLYESIYQKKEEMISNLIKIQPEHLEECKNCKVNLFCWSCLAEIELKLKDKEKFRERCEIQKKILYPLIWG